MKSINKYFFLLLLLPLCAFAASAKAKKPAAKPVPWVSLMDTASWQLTKAYQSAGKWSFADSTLEGTDGWIGHGLVLGDFALEGDFLYNGKSQGGVLLRGDRDAWLPWLHGYEMDIDADMAGYGHIHFPFRPQPNPGVVTFPVGEWQQFGVRAVGQNIVVKLNGKEAIRFRDDHYRFGRICLEGEKGGIKYRNLKVQRLDKKRLRASALPGTSCSTAQASATGLPKAAFLQETASWRSTEARGVPE